VIVSGDMIEAAADLSTETARRVRIFLIGELNPFRSDPYYDLWYEPRTSSGNRLRLILGLTDDEYIAPPFVRRNLLARRAWSLPAAREAARELLGSEVNQGDALVLCGGKVSAAFGFDFATHLLVPTATGGRAVLVIPHPSGLNRQWHVAGMKERVRTAVTALRASIDGGATR